MALGLGINATPLTTPLSWEPKDGRFNDELIFWLKNNTNVSPAAWLDESDNNNDVTQGTLGRQPTINEGGLKFDGVDDLLEFDNLITINPDSDFCLCIALEMDSDTSNTLLEENTLNKISLSTKQLITISGDDPEAANVTAIPSSTTIYDSPEKIWIIIQRSANGYFNVTDGNNKTFNITGQPFTKGITINKLGGFSDGYLDGTILEVFMYNTIFQHASELKKAEDHLKYKFSIY